MNARTVFAHHDKIEAAPSGSVIMVAEPIKAQRMPAGIMISLSSGDFLRKKFNGGGLWCEAVIDGKVMTVVVKGEDFASLEPAA